MKKLFLALIVIYSTVNSCHAAKLVWKTENFLGEAKQLPSCDPEKDKDCHDFVPYVSQSKYGVKVYFTYHEGVRITYSFNGKDEDGFTVTTDRLHPGAYDWGGVVEKDKFKPLYVIKRFYGYDDETDKATKARTELIILRLLENGKFCGVETGTQVVTDNGAARRFAEKNFANPACAK